MLEGLLEITHHIKGTVDVIEDYPLFTECHAWFTMIQKSDLSDQDEWIIRYPSFLFDTDQDVK